MEGLGLDGSFLRRCRQLARITLLGATCTLLLFLLVLSVTYQVVVYHVGLMTSQYYVILVKRDRSGFFYHTGFCVGLIILVALVRSARTYVANTVSIQWRQLITKRLQELYFAGKVHYEVNVVDNTVDNPDQRIVQDVDRLCEKLTDIVPALLISPFTISYYTHQSFMVSGYTGPLSVVIYFVVSTAVNKLLIAPVVPRVYEQEKREGGFRYKHAQVRSNSESIAFLDGEDAELKSTQSYLVQLMKAQQSVVDRQFPLNVAVAMSDYIGSVVAFLVLAVPVFDGTYDEIQPSELSGIISKNAFVSMYLISCFSGLLHLSNGISTVAGNTHRICVLLEHMEALVEDAESGAHGEEDVEGPSFKLVDVSYCSPHEKQPLVQHLSGTFSPGKSILVDGPSNGGKTSLLRVLKGLWQPSSGTVVRIPRGSLFLPQVPWFGSGSLRCQLCYPYPPPQHCARDDEDMKKLFQLADLEHLVNRAGGLDTSLEPAWYDSLSPGEKQRLCFLRVLWQRPRLVFLDEATSALGTDVRIRLYEQCKRLDISTVSIGHHDGLEALHHGLLRLLGDGKWAEATPPSANLAFSRQSPNLL